MNINELRHNLRQGNRVFGTLIVSESPLWPRAIATTGLDFVFIDTEHTALTANQVAGMCQAYRGVNLPPIVRIPAPDPHRAAKMIDVGAVGIIAPYIETPEQAAAMVGAVRFRPLKGKRLSARLAEGPIEPELEEYLRNRNDTNVLVLNIESVPAMEALDEILSVDGIDAVLIGPHDLSCSLGIPEQYDHPRFLDSCESILGRARRHQLGAGIHFTGAVEQQIRFLEMGANMVIHCADITIAARHIKKDIAALRDAAGEAKRDGTGEIDAI